MFLSQFACFGSYFPRLHCLFHSFGCWMALVLSSPGKHVNVFAGCVGMAWKGGLKSVNSRRDIGNHVRDPYYIEMRLKSQIFYTLLIRYTAINYTKEIINQMATKTKIPKGYPRKNNRIESKYRIFGKNRIALLSWRHVFRQNWFLRRVQGTYFSFFD